MEQETPKQGSLIDKIIKWLKAFIWTDIGVTVGRCIFIYVDTHYLTPNLYAMQSVPWYVECILTIGLTIAIMIVLGLIIIVLKWIKRNKQNKLD